MQHSRLMGLCSLKAGLCYVIIRTLSLLLSQERMMSSNTFVVVNVASDKCFVDIVIVAGFVVENEQG